MEKLVYFSPIVTDKHQSQLDIIEKLINKLEIQKKFNKHQMIAVKVHFGEFGNTSHLRAIYLKPLIKKLKEIGAKPYLTDTNTLYVGMRTNSVDHIHNAFYNGFNFEALQVPVIIGDGLRGEYSVPVDVNLELCQSVKLGGNIINADGMIVVSHFKAHEVAGFGAALKNLSMGCASRSGKLEMHSKNRPMVIDNICIGCGKCLKHCQIAAIKIDKKAIITEKCVGCMVCSAVCPVHAIDVEWNETAGNTQKMMVEYAYGVNKVLQSNIFYINVLKDMTPFCDCYKGGGNYFIHDIGFLASTDPIAIDKASYDLVLQAAGKDVFKKIYPYLDPEIQFQHAKKIQFGSLDYTLMEI